MTLLHHIANSLTAAHSHRLLPVLLPLAAALLGGCSFDEAAPTAADEVELSLSFAVSTQAPAATRMAAAVTQDGTDYRGMQSFWAIPFAKLGKVTRSDHPNIVAVSDLGIEARKTASWFYYYDNCRFKTGTSAFVAYGQAVPLEAPASLLATATDDIRQKAYNGAVDYHIPESLEPSNIRFSPQSILGSTTSTPQAEAIAAFLTDLANTSATYGSETMRWGGNSAGPLKAIYNNFIANENDGYKPIPSSAACVKADLANIRKQLEGIDTKSSPINDNLRLAIIGKLTAGEDGFPETFPSSSKDYPSSVGMPDGAAVLKWNEKTQCFEPQTETNTLANVTSINRYAYPAELWYYANSRIATSNSYDKKIFYNSKETWSEVLDQHEYPDGIVTNDTKAVAIEQPLRYAVAQLKIELAVKDDDSSLETITLKDSHDAGSGTDSGNDITIGKETFPLTGIIVGRQHPQGFDFTPAQPISDLNEYFVYDANPTSATGSAITMRNLDKGIVSTLLFQTPSEARLNDVPIALEFKNDSGQTFQGVGGVVYPGTKFYLVAKVRPADAESEADSSAPFLTQVLTRGYTTKLKMTVSSLKEAYNVLPDLMSARLELGVEVITPWEQATPVEVSFD